VTAAAWPRFGSRTVSLSVLVTDSSCVKHVVFLCLRCAIVNVTYLFCFLVNTFYVNT